MDIIPSLLILERVFFVLNEFDRRDWRGKVFKSNNSGKFKVTLYESTNKITIEFLDTKGTLVTNAGSIRAGSLNDCMATKVLGLGFVGGLVLEKKIYNAWLAMMQRCYSHKKGAIVCEEWHNFQEYQSWYIYNCVPGWQVDKDLLSGLSKEYSPSTCTFL